MLSLGPANCPGRTPAGGVTQKLSNTSGSVMAQLVAWLSSDGGFDWVPTEMPRIVVAGVVPLALTYPNMLVFRMVTFPIGGSSGVGSRREEKELLLEGPGEPGGPTPLCPPPPAP